MDPDDVIILASPQHPIKATRIKYYEDPKFMAMMDVQEGKVLPYPPQQRQEVAARKEQKVEASDARAPGGESERSEPKAERLTLRNKPSRKMKLEIPEAGVRGASAINLGELDRDAPVSKSHLDLIREGQEFSLEQFEGSAV